MQQQHIASVDFTWMMQTLGFCSKTQGEKHHVQPQNSTKESIAQQLTHFNEGAKQRRRRRQWKRRLKKMNLRSFKLYRVYLDSLNLSNGGDVSSSWILMDFIHVHKEKGKFLVLCSRPV